MKRQANALDRCRDHRSHFLLKTIIALEIGFFLLLGSGDRAVSQPPETSQVVNSSSIPARRTIQCEGWTLHVSEDLYTNEAELLEKALHLLEKQLQEIVRVVPERALKQLQQVPLWISEEYPGIRHELAHAYHDRFLPEGFENARVRAAYDKAKASGKYESVEQRFGDGRSANVRAYAMTTPQEYFAECSEAFFSTNMTRR